MGSLLAFQTGNKLIAVVAMIQPSAKLAVFVSVLIDYYY